ncbi:MAG TPA: PrsW family glutamic-type intramembrane protease, partial [Polyangiaceae bacterium LLY-WYZ-15_(1-7)]|nr:PrsW family glutamic-type intramembrane protease [Polyangiaceae bacterium LLY-WYZ-15_(1-7)]
MERIRCCVCHEGFDPDEVEWLGGRSFCKEHHRRAIEATETHWSRAGLLEAALVALFVLVVALVFGGSTLPTSVDVGLGLALVPAVIWLVFIYRQDRVEPEPFGLVAGVYLLGALFGHALVDPLAEKLVAASGGLEETSALGAWVHSVAIEGTLAVLAAYVVVRYTVYLTDEFDEPVDGVIYATAASLGVATAQNVAFVAHHAGVLPVAGATQMASTTLIHVASGVLLGYGLGRRRFDASEGGRWLAASFLAAVVAHGAFHELVVMAGAARGGFDPWMGFGVA